MAINALWDYLFTNINPPTAKWSFIQLGELEQCRVNISPPVSLKVTTLSSRGSWLMKIVNCDQNITNFMKPSAKGVKYYQFEPSSLINIITHISYGILRVLPSILFFSASMCLSCFNNLRRFFPDKVMFARGLVLCKKRKQIQDNNKQITINPDRMWQCGQVKKFTFLHQVSSAQWVLSIHLSFGRVLA